MKTFPSILATLKKEIAEHEQRLQKEKFIHRQAALKKDIQTKKRLSAAIKRSLASLENEIKRRVNEEVARRLKRAVENGYAK